MSLENSHLNVQRTLAFRLCTVSRYFFGVSVIFLGYGNNGFYLFVIILCSVTKLSC